MPLANSETFESPDLVSRLKDKLERAVGKVEQATASADPKTRAASAAAGVAEPSFHRASEMNEDAMTQSELPAGSADYFESIERDPALGKVSWVVGERATEPDGDAERGAPPVATSPDVDADVDTVLKSLGK